MKTKSRVVCFVGPSGVGKSSFALRLVRKHGFALPFVVTMRAPRSDDDHRYRYVDQTTFKRMVIQGLFLEWDIYMGHAYGTLRENIEEHGRNPDHPGLLLDLTPAGCRKICSLIPQATVVALLPDDPAWLARRLFQRGTDSPVMIRERTEILHRYLAEVRALNSTHILERISIIAFEPREAISRASPELEGEEYRDIPSPKRRGGARNQLSQSRNGFLRCALINRVLQRVKRATLRIVKKGRHYFHPMKRTVAKRPSCSPLLADR